MKTEGQTKPALTISEAADRTGVTARTLRRYISKGRFNNAWRQDAPRQSNPWMIPVVDLLGVGLTVDSGDMTDRDDSARSVMVDSLLTLEDWRRRAEVAETKVEETKVEALERLLREKDARIDELKEELKRLEPQKALLSGRPVTKLLSRFGL